MVFMRNRSALLAVIGTGACAAMIFNILPVFLGKAAESFSLSDSAAGWLATVYLAGFGISSASAAFWLHRIDRRKATGLAFVGAALLLSAGAWLDSHFGLMAALGVAGLFLGVLYSISFVLAGEFDDAVRAVGFKLGGEVALGAILIFLLPVIIYPVFGFVGILTALALILLVASPVALTVAPRSPPQSAAATTGKFSGGGLLPAGALAGLAALLVFTMGQSALWSFVERAGVRAGYDPSGIGLALSAAVLMGGLGAMVAAIMGKRFGNSVPVISAAVVYGLALWGLSTGGEFAAFAAGINLFFFVWLFALPYFVSAIAAVDKSGRATSLVSACFAFGSMAGPAMASVLMAAGDFRLLYLFCAAVVLTALLTLFGLARREAAAAREPRD